VRPAACAGACGAGPRAAAVRRGRRLVGAGVVVVLALVGGCTADRSSDDRAGATPTRTSAPPTSTGTGAATTGAGTTSTGTTGAGAADRGAGSGAGPSEPGAGDDGSVPGGTQAPGTSSETLPTPAPHATQPPPSPAPTGPSLTGPLPASASARGERLVAGFPTRVVPVLAELRVVSSSVAAQGARLQIGLEASADVSPTAVLDAYVTALARSGFTASASPALPGSTATAFTRGTDGVTVTVRDRLGGGTELVLAGTLSTAG